MKLVVRDPRCMRRRRASAAAEVDTLGADRDLHGVSFAHGSNDGQKGMGLIMLVLIGTVPTAYALNRAVPEREYVAEFQVNSSIARRSLFAAHAGGVAPPTDARGAVTKDIADKTLQPVDTVSCARRAGGRTLTARWTGYGSLAKVPAAATENMRNDMYLASQAIQAPRLRKRRSPFPTRRPG